MMNRLTNQFHWGIFLLVLILTGCTPKKAPLNVLIFSKTEGFRHKSIEPGIAAIEELGKLHGFNVQHTEDAKMFTQKDLQDYNVVVFLSTTGNILNDVQQLEFQRWIQAGGGFVGIHAATDTEYDWPWYNGLVGGYFAGHPPGTHEATIEVAEADHISTRHLPAEWIHTDEWYNFRKLTQGLNTLLNLDETTYQGGEMGADHPIAWYHEYDGGRSWYTALGHTSESFAEPLFLEHLWGGIQYAAGTGDQVDYRKVTVAPDENRFQKVVLADNLNEPMELDFLDEGKIIFIERYGDVKIYNPSTRVLDKAFHINVNTKFEDGLLGLAVDPDFEANHWVYFFYSHPVESHQVVARFTYYPDSIYTFADEKVILTIPTQRKECCHAGGSIQFGPDKLLYIGTGDNTNPFKSDGFSPSDDRPGRAPFDARRTSANTNDLRGKVLRIKIEDDGTYSIPEGNLFPPGTDGGRPEIFAMGCRNPFRVSVDQKTGTLFWGDVGPDSPKDGMVRGPMGHDEINKTDRPGFFGWPLLIGNNKAYYRYDFAREKTLELFDQKQPLNQSRYNTGMETLPAATPAFIWYPYKKSEEFPLLGTGGRTAMAGPVYYTDLYENYPNKFPAYFDGKFFFYEWMRGWIMVVTFNEDGSFKTMERFMPTHKFSNPVDMEFTANGELYLLEYGKIWNHQNEDARLVHLQYNPGNRAPIVEIEASEKYGVAPMTVSLSADSTLDYDNDALSFEWYVNGESIGRESNISYTFTQNGVYSVRLKATDAQGKSASRRKEIWVGNAEPVLNVAFSDNQTFYWDNQQTAYEVNVDDDEDGTLGNGILAEAVTISMDYLEQGFDMNEIAIGHQVAAVQSVGERLISESTCLSCHQKKQTSVGPAYYDVAVRYAEEKPMDVLRLANKIIKGGAGVWGDHVMSAHPDLPLADATQMVEYILSLDDEENKVILPVQGTFVFDQHLEQEFGGLYIIKATYTDKGGNDIEPITAHEQLILRHNKLRAADFDFDSHSRLKVIKKKKFPDIEEDQEIVEINLDNYIGFKEIDLTGVKYLRVHLFKSHAGSLEVRVGSSEGAIIGQTDLSEQSGNDPNWGSVDIALEEAEYKSDLLLFYRKKNEEKGSVNLFYLEFLQTVAQPITLRENVGNGGLN